MAGAELIKKALRKYRVPLDKDVYLLEWLSKEDSSSYGECCGKALDRLTDAGLAVVNPDWRKGGTPKKMTGYERVSLTDAGWSALKKARDTASPSSTQGAVDGAPTRRPSRWRHYPRRSNAMVARPSGLHWR